MLEVLAYLALVAAGFLWGLVTADWLDELAEAKDSNVSRKPSQQAPKPTKGKDSG